MEIADFTGKKVLICYIAQSYKELMEGKPWRSSFLDCVCKYWDIPNLTKGNNADFIVGVKPIESDASKKEIVVVAKADTNGWQKVKTFPELKAEIKNDTFLERYAFKGTDISKTPEAAPFIGKILPSNIKFFKDITYPLYCVNGEIIDWTE